MLPWWPAKESRTPPFYEHYYICGYIMLIFICLLENYCHHVYCICSKVRCRAGSMWMGIWSSINRKSVLGRRLKGGSPTPHITFPLTHTPLQQSILNWGIGEGQKQEHNKHRTLLYSAWVACAAVCCFKQSEILGGQICHEYDFQFSRETCMECRLCPRKQFDA